MDSIERERLLHRYASGAKVVEGAVSGLTNDQLDRPSGDVEGWTARQVTHHLADSESMAYIRLRRLLAEDRPLLAAYDEPEWARRLHYERPVVSSLTVIASVRAASLELLLSLTDGEWEREGTHSASGRFGVEDWLKLYADHPYDHADQIRASATSSQQGRV